MENDDESLMTVSKTEEELSRGHSVDVDDIVDVVDVVDVEDVENN